MLLINVQTTNTDKYNFACSSTPILIKAKTETVLTSTQDAEPNLYLTFSGNFSSLTSDSLKKFEAMIYNCLLVKYGLVIQSSIQLYQGSVKAVVDTTGTSSAYSTLISDLNSTNFTLASGVVLQSVTIDGRSYMFNTQSNNDNDEVVVTANKIEENNNVLNLISIFFFKYFSIFLFCLK